MDSNRYTRRDALAMLGTTGTVALSAMGWTSGGGETQPAGTAGDPVARNDEAVRSLIQRQVTDSASSYRGSVPDDFDLHSAGSAGSVVETMAAAFVSPASRFHRDPVLLDRIRLAAGFLERSQSAEGNIDLLTTNFNSPPDTGFVVHLVAAGGAIARRHGAEEITRALQPFLVKAGGGMASGGVHTPNHRWVICSALAQVNELFPDARLMRRIDQWLAEGIDIDADGQFTERSTLTYNVVTDRALVVMAAKLKRPELLDPVRRNLTALSYLLHADGEVVTEISRRQDQYTRGGIDGYWFPLTYLALLDRTPVLNAMARQAAGGARLSTLLEYPELGSATGPAAELPSNFERTFPEIGIARIRRERLSATLILGGSSRLLSLHNGAAVVEGVRFATAFFGKGQFIPDSADRSGSTYRFRQSLEAPYYQPLGQQVTTDTWASVRPSRAQTQVNRLTQSAEIVERTGGFDVRLRAEGTPGVPLAVEIGLRDGGTLEGCEALAGNPGCFLLSGGTGTLRVGRDEITFGPGVTAHRYVQVRGAEPRLPGRSVYLTGYTPFDHTLRFSCR